RTCAPPLSAHHVRYYALDSYRWKSPGSVFRPALKMNRLACDVLTQCIHHFIAGGGGEQAVCRSPSAPGFLAGARTIDMKLILEPRALPGGAARLAQGRMESVRAPARIILSRIPSLSLAGPRAEA